MANNELKLLNSKGLLIVIKVGVELRNGTTLGSLAYNHYYNTNYAITTKLSIKRWDPTSCCSLPDSSGRESTYITIFLVR